MQRIRAAKHLMIYADDDRDDLTLVKDALLSYEDTVEVCLFESGLDAYDFLLAMEKSNRKPCLVVLDMNMPGLSGRELLPVLRGIPFFNDVPIILFTTSSAKMDYEFARAHGAGFITKPMTYEQMEIVAEQLLSRCAGDVRVKPRL